MTIETLKLAGRVAIVTGAASGIGAASAVLFATHGARVLLVDRDAAGLDATAQAIRDADGEARVLVADVTDGATAHAAVQQLHADWQRIDVLMLCSGVSVGGTVDSIPETLWDTVFEINVKGSYLWMHAALPYMIERHSGSIILLGSQLVSSSGGNNAAYIASKGAITALAKTMAVDHAQQGIRVNALVPGVIDTAMVATSVKRYADPAATRARWAERHAMRRLGTADEVARAALFLASDDASFTTGSQLFVDGGWSAM